MKKIFAVFLLIASLTGCNDFLNEIPNESGQIKFSKASQFDALLNSIFITRDHIAWQTAIIASDDCHFTPDWQTYGSGTMLGNTPLWEGWSIWNKDMYESLKGGFTAAYSNMYTFNYIIESIDNPLISGSLLLKKQVKAEAKFWRALYHFLVAVEFCQHPGLNNGNTPGIGYRNTISLENTGIEKRKTVKFTFDNIIKDLDEAEKDLAEVGKTSFSQFEPWRITTPAVQSVLARIYLYLGNYQKAFENAKKAYTVYSFLYDLNNTTLFSMVNLGGVQTEVYNGVTYSVQPLYPAISADINSSNPNGNSNYWYKEAYFRLSGQFGIIKMPPTQQLYDLYVAQDLRKKVYYDNNQNINTSQYMPPRFKDQLISKSYLKNSNSTSQMGYILGTTVPEMMLIMAECRARNAGDGENASIILKQLRAKRFPTGYVDNIGGTLQEVKDERRRELAMLFRWHDVKRYNALDNANIVIIKTGRTDPYLLISDIVTWKLAPNSPAYALPMPRSEVELLKWEQNEYSGVTKN